MNPVYQVLADKVIEVTKPEEVKCNNCKATFSESFRNFKHCPMCYAPKNAKKIK